MLQQAVDQLTYQILNLPSGERWTEVIHFFIYDSVKILSLIFIMITSIGFLRTWIPHEKLRPWLNQNRPGANFLAALFGALTPFCSCSSIPIFLSLTRAGVPLGVMFSFLATSPLINEYLVILMGGFFGWKITAVYVISGLALGTVCGIVIGKLKLEKWLVKDMLPSSGEDEIIPVTRTLVSRALFGLREAISIIKKLWLWILLGVGIGALIHNYVPSEAIHSVIKKTGVFSVPVATLFGVPLYGSCAAIVPVAVVLFQKGVPLGTALAFMMAISALSLPEAVMLRRAMKLPLIAIFFTLTTLGIILAGYLVNAFQPFLV